MDSKPQGVDPLAEPVKSIQLLDEYSLAIVRGGIFIDRLHWYRRTVHRISDTTLKIKGDEFLQDLAARFCQEHTDKFFPDIWTTGSPNVELLFNEVLWQYRNLRADLLNKSRLKRRLPPECLSEPIMPASPAKNMPVACPPLRASSQPPAPKKRPRRRHRHKHRVKESVELPIVVAADNVQDTKSHSRANSMIQLSDVEEIPSQNQKALLKIESIFSGSGSGSGSRHVVLPERPQIFKKITPLQLAEQMTKLKESSQKQQEENQKLKDEIKTLTDYRIFVERSLAICRDTYLAEGQSAGTVGLVAKTGQCKAVVEALRDLQSDFDFKYFYDHHRLYKREPPSRFWLDGVRRSKQMHLILRS